MTSYQSSDAPPLGGARVPGPRTTSATGATGIAGATSAGDILVEGTTEVLPVVVQKVAAFAAGETPGVVALGGGAARAAGAVRQTLTGGTGSTAGVRVDLEDQKARIGIALEIQYGVAVREMTRTIRRHVPQAVEEMAGVPVVELDIVITDIHLPTADAEPGA